MKVTVQNLTSILKNNKKISDQFFNKIMKISFMIKKHEFKPKKLNNYNFSIHLK